MKPFGVPAGLTLALLASTAASHDAAVQPSRNQSAWSTQMHLHGSFSEGRGSMTGGTVEARNTGVDVLWWSDHAFGFHHKNTARTFGFEDWWEYEWEGEDWTPSPANMDKMKYWQLDTDAGMASYAASFTDAQAVNGERSLRIEATSNETDFAHLYYRFDTDRDAVNRARTLAAGTTIEISVYAGQVGADATAMVSIELSRHRENPVVDLQLHYYLDNSPGAAPFMDGGDYFVPLAYTAGAWNSYVLDLTADAVAGFTDLPGEDNNAFGIKVGARARNGATAVVHFDAFRLDYRIGYPEIFTRQRELLDTIAAGIPEVVQHQGMELHVGKHLNEFSVHAEPPPFNGPIYDAVQAVHDRGGLVSYNHMFGAGVCGSTGETPESVLPELLVTRVYGADLLEVGYRCRSGRDLDDFLWVWDQLTAAQIYITGTGVSDDHNLAPGSNAGRPNNFVSWIYADSADKTDLIDGLRRGRVYFGDINLFDGHVDLSTPAGARMGQVVFTDLATAGLTIDIDGLEAGDRLVSIHDGEPVNSYTATGAVLSITEQVPVAATGSFARIEVYAPDGTAKVFSNPVHFVRRVNNDGVSPFRSAIELSGAQSISIDNYFLRRATLRGDGQEAVMILGGTADKGTVVLAWTRTERPHSVTFQGMSGTWSFDNGRLTLGSLQGEGSIIVQAARPGKGAP